MRGAAADAFRIATTCSLTCGVTGSASDSGFCRAARYSGANGKWIQSPLAFSAADVLLSGGDEREAFGGFAGRPLVPVETVHHVAGDAVFLQHHGDGLRGVEGRIPLAAALGVGDDRLLELIGESEVISAASRRPFRSRRRSPPSTEWSQKER